MRLLTTFLTFLHAAQGLIEVSGYVGESVVLPSGADPSWNLSSIKWSIFPNTTWIATYSNGKTNVRRFYRYKGRLGLNTSTGNLMIHNLNSVDAMEYTVDLFNSEKKNSVNKIKLTVKQHLRKPTIQTLSSRPSKDVCWMGLHCVSEDAGVTVSGETNPPNVSTTYMSGPDGKSVFLLVVLNTTQDRVEFTCTSSRNTDKASRNVTLTCQDEEPQPQPQPVPVPSAYRDRGPLVFLGGFVVGSLIVIFLCCLKGRIKGAWECITKKMSQLLTQ